MNSKEYAALIQTQDLHEGIKRQRRLAITYKKIVENLLKKSFNGKLLDTGCGNNSFIEAAKEFGLSGVGIDFDSVNFEESPFPFDDCSFDVVTANALIEHIRNPALYLKEVKRVLKKGGLFLFTTPNWELSYKTFYNEPTHVHPYTPKGLRTQLNAFGFNVLFLEPNFICRPAFMWKLPWRWKIPMGTRSMLCVSEKP